ncbi:MAG: hypothetical protein MJ238_02485, partial [Bacilli bacterium]|nr:hypothetical protein [Bacilli bacterium]
MKKAINILLKVSLIVDIIAIVSCVALFIIGIALVPLGVELANELESNSSPEVVITFTLVFSAIFVFPL